MLYAILLFGIYWEMHEEEFPKSSRPIKSLTQNNFSIFNIHSLSVKPIFKMAKEKGGGVELCLIDLVADGESLETWFLVIS